MFNQHDEDEDDGLFGDGELTNIDGDGSGGPMGLGGIPNDSLLGEAPGLGGADPGQGGGDTGMWPTPKMSDTGEGAAGNGDGHSRRPDSGSGLGLGTDLTKPEQPPAFVSTPKQPMAPVPDSGRGVTTFSGSAPKGFTSVPSTQPFKPKVLGQAMPLSSGSGVGLASLSKGQGGGMPEGNGSISAIMNLLRQRKGMF